MSIKKPKNSQVPPKASRDYREIAIEEFLAFWSFLRHNWYFVLPALLIIALLIYIVRPLPPKQLRLATGQPNSTFQVIGEQYRSFFAKQGVDLALVPTKGAQENIELLRNGAVDAVFSQGGLKIDDPEDTIRSLGSISLQPLWLFYRGEEVATSENLKQFLVNRRTSLNLPGSGTRLLTDTILKLHKIDPEDSHYVSLSTRKSIDALKASKIDAMFLVAGVESKNLHELLAIPGIHAFNFDLADAYTKRLRYLDEVNLPKGALEFEPISPIKNVSMVATSVVLLATNQLHPAHQLLFLEAASEFDNYRIAVFNRETRFPAYTDQSVPESEFAERYYKRGSPLLWGHAPFWVVSLFDEIWFYVIAAGAVLIPLISFAPSYRKSHAEASIEECYTELRLIEVHLIDASKKEDLVELQSETNSLKERIWRLWVPTGNRPAYYDLKNALILVQEEISKKIRQADAIN